jgi:probable HAF family extracellular repeat protein
VPGSSATFATAVNNNGDIVGYSESGGETSGFLYTNGSFQTISPCPYGGTEPTGINDAGVIVGDCNGDPFIYQNGNVSYLSYPKARYTFLMGINNQGVLVGGLGECAHFRALLCLYQWHVRNSRRHETSRRNQ